MTNQPRYLDSLALDSLAYDISEVLNNDEHDMDVDLAPIRDALPAFLAAITTGSQNELAP